MRFIAVTCPCSAAGRPGGFRPTGETRRKTEDLGESLRYRDKEIVHMHYASSIHRSAKSVPCTTVLGSVASLAWAVN